MLTKEQAIFDQEVSVEELKSVTGGNKIDFVDDKEDKIEFATQQNAAASMCRTIARIF